MGKKRLEMMEKKEVYGFRFVYQHSKLLTVLAVFGIIVVGAYLRLNTVYLQGSLYAEYGRFFPRNDDSWWHYHWMVQVQRYGYRLDPDPETWAPEGRVVGHPPLFHYFIPYLQKYLFPSVPLFDVAFFYPLFAGLVGIVVWFLLCRELYGPFGGIVGAFLYSTAMDLSWKTWVGNMRPSGHGEILFALGLLLFFFIHRTGRKILFPLPGIIIGLGALFWEGILLFNVPLFIVFWVSSAIFRKADRRFHVMACITVLISTAIAGAWFFPVYARYSFGHQNTPVSQASNVMWYSAGGVRGLIGLLTGSPIFALSLIAFPLFGLYVLFHRRERRDILPMLWMIVGLGSMLLFGLRMIDVYLVYGALLVFAGLSSKIWHAANVRGKIQVGVLLFSVLLAQCVWSFHLTYNCFHVVYEASPNAIDLTTERYLPVMQLMGSTIPYGSTVLAWWGEGAFLNGIGARNVWDLYLEHLPAWHKNRGKQVSEFYLTTNETRAWELAHQLNVSYVLVDKSYSYPWGDQMPSKLSYMLMEYMPESSSESYFNNLAVTVKRPHAEIVGGQLVIIPNKWEETIVGYEYGPTGKGRETMLARLIWNKDTGNVLKNNSLMPEPLQQFKLVWKSSNSEVMIYRVSF
jgi:hypothetical protein